MARKAAAKKTTSKKEEEVKEEGVVDAASSETGENTDGVMSPHSGVGEKVPGDVVPPGHKVDPRTGAVIEGAGTDLATPRPNPRDPGKPVSAKPGQEWAGNHTV